MIINITGLTSRKKRKRKQREVRKHILNNLETIKNWLYFYSLIEQINN